MNKKDDCIFKAVTFNYKNTHKQRQQLSPSFASRLVPSVLPVIINKNNIQKCNIKYNNNNNKYYKMLSRQSYGVTTILWCYDNIMFLRLYHGVTTILCYDNMTILEMQNITYNLCSYHYS